MTDTPAPKIEFPCPRYPIKVIGDAGEGFSELIISVISRHSEGFDTSSMSERPSSNGRFVSVQVHITAISIEQLEAINVDLRATGRVHMVL